MSIHKLRALEYLVAVVEHGSFAAAARQLGVAAPSVHRLVRALEGELGLPLLRPDGTRLMPTPDARTYVERARELMTDLQTLDASLRDSAQVPGGTVVLAAQSVVSHFVLAEALPRFHEAYQGIRIDLRDAGASRDLGQLGADMLLMFGWPPPQPAVMRTLAQTRWLVVGAPSFWSRHGVPAHPSDLARLPCALFRVPYGEVLRRWSFVRAGERVEVEVDGWLLGDDRVALDSPVLAGQMVARVNDLTAMSALRSGALQPVLLDWEGQHAPPLNLLFSKSLSRQPRVRALVDFLVAHLEACTRQRVPAGLPPVPVSRRPDWFKRRVA